MLNIMKSRLSTAKAGFAGRNLPFLFVAFLLLELTTFAQTKWNKYAGNPVLEKGSPGNWDASHVRQPSVLWDGTKYNMWYAGMDGGVQAMGYATSTDGIHWSKDTTNNPVLERGAPGSWDDDFIVVTSVLFDGTLFKIWYTAGGGKTGLATSPDEIHWSKDTINNPVLAGTPGTWDADIAAGAQVIYENSIYKMWYMGGGYNSNFGFVVMKLGYAESDSGISWTKHPGPVMEEGDYLTWANDLTNPFVIHEDSNYTMWYVSRNTFSNSHGEQINYATSPDGLEWTKSEDNPVLLPGISPAWDYLSIWKPTIIKENNLYKMWYTGETNQEMSIGYAEDFSNLVHADSVIIEESYVIPNTDTLNILGRVISLEAHTLTAKAFIVSDDGSTQDSVELFDDGLHGDGTAGDGIYGGYWLATNTNETNYTVGIKTVDLVTGFTRNGLNWNITNKFTTIGPVVVEDYVITSIDTIPNAGDQIRFKLKLRNNGLTATAIDIMAVISSTDSCISEISDNSAVFGDIAAGQSVIPISNFQQYTVKINPNCPGNSDVLFNVDIYSDGNFFWSDSFAFHIYVTGILDDRNSLPDKYALHQNYPNPFNPSTKINYQIPELSFVTLKVYDVLGNEIATLVNEEKPIGTYEVEWNASNVPSGVYFYQLRAGDPSASSGHSFVDIKKMMLLK